MVSNDLTKRIAEAKADLVIQYPLFGVLCLTLPVLEDTTCLTAWTDGRQIGYNPKFISVLSDGQLMFLLAHEVMHCVLQHPFRLKNRLRETSNRAADYVINLILKECGMEMIPYLLMDSNYAGMSTESVYDVIKDEPDYTNIKRLGPICGEVKEFLGTSEEEVKDILAWEKILLDNFNKIKYIKSPSLTSLLRLLISNRLNPAINWKNELQEWVSEFNDVKLSWNKFNKRHIHNNIYLPGKEPDTSIVSFAIAIDVSGSINRCMFYQFMAEVQDIMTVINFKRIIVLFCDTAVTKIIEVEKGADLAKLEICGGGGTDFRPVFIELENYESDITGLIFLTDLKGTFPENAPNYPVIWCNFVKYEGVAIPFGKVITIT